MVWSSSLTRGVVGVVEGRGHRCWLLSTRDVLTLTRVVEVVVVVCGGAGTGPEGGWQSRMLTRHTSTEHVTYPSPAKMGTGTSRVNFSSPIPIPVTPVPAIPHGFGFLCPSLKMSVLLSEYHTLSGLVQLPELLASRVGMPGGSAIRMP